MRSEVALLTGGGDRPYALGISLALAAEGVSHDFLGSDFLEAAELRTHPCIRFLNLRGDTNPEAPLARKAIRVLRYYARLIRYAASAEPAIFHILWNNKFETFDRTLLLWYYRLCGRRIVMTIHNVNMGARDGHDTLWNRLTLKAQYRTCEHLFVHTTQMKEQLQQQFNVPAAKVSVIPFGINSTVPYTDIDAAQARARLGLQASDQVLLFFGNIAPYKGLEVAVEALWRLRERLPRTRLVIAGRPKGEEAYWAAINASITTLGLDDRIIRRIEYVPDAETEIYFKAADVLVLPYKYVFQSGVLFLAYNFGLPVIAADVASMREDIVEGETGLLCRPSDPEDLACKVEELFASALYTQSAVRRDAIRQFARRRYSWSEVVFITKAAYFALRAR